MGNPSELREVLTNIIFNAVDAMSKGGKLTLITQPQAEDWVEVRIADTGIGMTEEVKKRVFDPFFTTKGVKNSGLGMSVSYGIVKRHGGEILIESEPGKKSDSTLSAGYADFCALQSFHRFQEVVVGIAQGDVDFAVSRGWIRRRASG